MAYQGHILSGSPFYITENGTAGFTSTLNIFIWKGAAASPPATPTYTIVKQAIEITTTVVNFEISKLLDDYVQVSGNEYTIADSASNVAYFVKVTSTGGTSNRDDYYLFTSGWSRYTDGINYQPSGSPLLMKHKTVYIVEKDYGAVNPIKFPLYYTSANRVSTYRAYSNGTEISAPVSVADTGTEAYSQVRHWTADSFYTSTSGVGAATFYADLLKFSYNDNTITDTLYIKRYPCNSQTEVEVLFQNSFGVLQQLWFMGTNRKTIDVTRSNFQRQVITSATSAAAYDASSHQYMVYNTTGRNSLTLNSGFVDEGYYNHVEELLNSKAVWIVIDSVMTPVIVKTNSLQYRTNINDRTINYSIDFEYAFNYKNSVY